MHHFYLLSVLGSSCLHPAWTWRCSPPVAPVAHTPLIFTLLIHCCCFCFGFLDRSILFIFFLFFFLLLSPQLCLVVLQPWQCFLSLCVPVWAQWVLLVLFQLLQYQLRHESWHRIQCHLSVTVRFIKDLFQSLAPVCHSLQAPAPQYSVSLTFPVLLLL